MLYTILKSYAKINIGLRVLRRRADGYHDLETIFYPIKLHDEISIQIEPSDSGYNSVTLKSNKPYIPLNKDNLCYKSIENFFKLFKIKDWFKINIDIKKNIPVGGGLGGGSSNAATILKFLIKYFNLNIADYKNQILDLALSIGSDVPFFLTLKPCIAEGRGEKLTPLENFVIDYDILIVNPNLHISTKWAFEKLRLKPNEQKESLLKEVKKFDADNLNLFVNDFEKVVLEKYGALKNIKNELLNAGAIYASMSGSGATMYGLFKKENKDKLRMCRRHYLKKKYFTFISE